MAITFTVFHDSALTSPVTSGAPISLTALEGGHVDIQLWFGSASSSVQIQDEASPGSAQITLTPHDSATGSGQPASSVKLALTQGALDSATGGAGLDIGHTVQSGSANAVSFWWRWTPSGSTAAEYTDISLITQNLKETATA